METSYEVTSLVQQVDVFYQPHSEQAGDCSRLEWLAQMTATGPCLLELFSQPLGLHPVQDCVRQQLVVHQQRCQHARRHKQTPPEQLPALWILSAGCPNRVIQAYNLQPMQDWPPGFWQRNAVDAWHVVVLTQLPREPSTLPLRLLGRGATLRDAVRDWRQLPVDTWLPAVALPVLAAFHKDTPEDGLEEQEMQALREVQALYAQWEQKLKDEAEAAGLQKGLKKGLKKGEAAGLKKGIEALCEALDITLTPERRHVLATGTLAQLRELLGSIRANKVWPPL